MSLVRDLEAARDVALALQNVAWAAQLLRVKGRNSFGDQLIYAKSWDALQKAIEALPASQRILEATEDII